MRLTLIIILILVFSNAYGLCFKDKHVPGSSGTPELCEEQYAFEQQVEFDRLQQKKEAHEQAVNNNTGQGSGQGNIINNIGAAISGNNGDQAADGTFANGRNKKTWELTVAINPFTLPAAGDRQSDFTNWGFGITHNLSDAFHVFGLYDVIHFKTDKYEDLEVATEIECMNLFAGAGLNFPYKSVEFEIFAAYGVYMQVKGQNGAGDGESYGMKEPFMWGFSVVNFQQGYNWRLGYKDISAKTESNRIVDTLNASMGIIYFGLTFPMDFKL